MLVAEEPKKMGKLNAATLSRKMFIGWFKKKPASIAFVEGANIKEFVFCYNAIPHSFVLNYASLKEAPELLRTGQDTYKHG